MNPTGTKSRCNEWWINREDFQHVCGGTHITDYVANNYVYKARQ